MKVQAIALDLGSTSIKAGLLSADGALTGIVTRPAPAMRTDGGRYESDALAYAELAEAVLEECLSTLREHEMKPFVLSASKHEGVQGLRQAQAERHGDSSAVASNGQALHPPLGLCCQRSSFLIWERASGQPVTPLISWQDDRGARAALHGAEAEIFALAGLPLTPYYLAPKLCVLLREHSSWREHLVSGDWLVGTLDTFLIWRWSGGRQYQTDASMAARTLLMDGHDMQWSPRLCEIFGVPFEVLPQIRPSVGWMLPLDRIGLTLRASVGDQSAAFVASVAEQSEALVNLGTGGFVMCHLPDGCDALPGYLHTLLWQDENGKAYFACEGTLNSIASALAPYPVADFRVEDLARDDIYCLAEPSGLGAPYFRKDMGLMFSQPVAGLSPQRVAALLLEGIIFRVARMLEDMHVEYGIERIYLSGGLSNLPCLQQGIARCVPFASTYRLLQFDAGLIGAAGLSTGETRIDGRCAEKIDILRADLALQEKYGRWKVWLDESLCGQ